MTYYRPWTLEEDAAIIVMREYGWNNTHIGRVMGRTREAVRSRFYEMAVSARLPEKRRCPTAAVKFAELPAWYELGWIPVTFSGDKIQMEWRASGEPQLLTTALRRFTPERDAVHTDDRVMECA